jgi:hypothetical protein
VAGRHADVAVATFGIRRGGRERQSEDREVIAMSGRQALHRIVTVVAAGVAALATGLGLGLAGAPPAGATVLFGNDISWPQCPSRFPTGGQFVIIGLTHGLPFTENPCVADQVAWAEGSSRPAQAYTMAGFPTSAQLSTYGSQGPWSTSTRAGRLSNVGYSEAKYAVATLSSIGWRPPVVWIDVEPRDAQPWPSSTWSQRLENRYVIEGLMRGLRDAGFAYGLYSNTSGWQSITGSWRLPGVPVWATAGLLDYPTEALDRCTQPSFSGGRVYIAQWWTEAQDFDYDRTCEPYQFTSLRVPPSALSSSTGDFNGDWSNDVLARWTTGVLRLYPGNGTGSFSPSLQVGTSWSIFSALETVGDFSGDGALDVLARERSTGYLWMYKGNGTDGWLLPRVRVGTSWNGMNAIVGPGDFNGDGRVDVIARQASNGYLYLYPGNGTGGWLPRVLVATGWNRYNTIVGAGDVNGDGRQDLISREPSTGRLWLHTGNGTGGIASSAVIGTSWNGMTALVAPGDFTGDRVADLLARDSSGRLWLYPRTASGGWLPRTLVGTGWNITNAIF